LRINKNPAQRQDSLRGGAAD